MAFRAVHAQWGAVFAHLPDLGCGQAWEAVWKARPAAPLVCDECSHRMFAKGSRNGLRFFAHAPGAPNCALALETLAHHMLKLELANAARDAGAHAEMEVRGPDGTWRADVLASDPGGTWRIALEAQLAPITAGDITDRTERMRADDVRSIWFTDRPRPAWLGVVPSVRLGRPDDGEGLAVAEGLVKWNSYGGGTIEGIRMGCWAPVQATLIQFLGWAFTGRVIPHRRRGVLDDSGVIWTAPRYARAEAACWAGLERKMERQRQSQERKPLTREQITNIRTAVLSAASAAERKARRTHPAGAAAWCQRAAQQPDVVQAVALLARKYDITATVGWSIGDLRYAGGIPLFDDVGRLAAVLGPEPQRIRRENYALMATTLLLFANKDRRAWFERVMKDYDPQPQDGWHVDHAEEVPVHGRT